MPTEFHIRERNLLNLDIGNLLMTRSDVDDATMGNDDIMTNSSHYRASDTTMQMKAPNPRCGRAVAGLHIHRPHGRGNYYDLEVWKWRWLCRFGRRRRLN
ncbi:hypothetical protein GUJ93_ZPchr0002g24999 [Zizania palustris]|uniref:Uncharacterized protein n=1 Tax=Zizania palustris TaxID=103762 RepID=A0A8J5RJ92_ZIZPA|nr:hypothetical protein GUJ93_ZPchr0002g24999 [Zizania palustris]